MVKKYSNNDEANDCDDDKDNVKNQRVSMRKAQRRTRL